MNACASIVWLKVEFVCCFIGIGLRSASPSWEFWDISGTKRYGFCILTWGRTIERSLLLGGFEDLEPGPGLLSNNLKPTFGDRGLRDPSLSFKYFRVSVRFICTLTKGSPSLSESELATRFDSLSSVFFLEFNLDFETFEGNLSLESIWFLPFYTIRISWGLCLPYVNLIPSMSSFILTFFLLFEFQSSFSIDIEILPSFLCCNI